MTRDLNNLSQSVVNKTDTFRTAFETYFNTATEGRGSFDTRLSQGGGLPPGLNNSLFFAQFADGTTPDGTTTLFSQITLLNLSEESPASGRIVLKSDDGTPLTVDLNGQVVNGELDFDIPAGGLSVFRTDGVGDVVTGSATVLSDQPLAGVVLFGGGVGLAGVGSSPETAAGFKAPMEKDAAAAINTGLALVNLESVPVTVSLDLVNSNGEVLASARETLVAMGHLALFVDQFDWAPAVDLSQFLGSVRVASTGRISATVIQTRPGQFATMPVAVN